MHVAQMTFSFSAVQQQAAQQLHMYASKEMQKQASSAGQPHQLYVGGIM
jgi:hypothetical protein